MLELRAGVGKAKPLTVAETARRVGLRERRIRRIERHALRRLEREARNGCAASPAPDGTGAQTTPAVATSSSGASTALADAGSSGAAIAPKPGGGGSTSSSGSGGSGSSSPRSGVKGEQRTHRASPRHFPSVLLPPGNPFPMFLLAIPAVAALAWFVVSRIRRRRRIDRLRYY